MKTTMARLAPLVLLALLIACATSAFSQDVTVDYDHHANFERYHTYSWKMVKMPDPLWDPRVQDAVNQELQKKGWQMVPSGGDVVLSAIGTTQTQTRLETFYTGPDWGGWGWGGFGTATTTPEQYQVGTLVIDMFEANTKKLIWRGVAQGTVATKPSKNEKKLEKAAEKMFKNFPPKPKQT
jgi:Domain of unknown function (DUF4136)